MATGEKNKYLNRQFHPNSEEVLQEKYKFKNYLNMIYFVQSGLGFSIATEDF